MKTNIRNGLRPKRVFVAISGGVDSSVAALLLQKAGYDVVGVFMRCYNIDGCAERDAEDARRVAEKIGIPFYVWDFEKEYRKKVVDYMIRGYRAGITPNPDIMCNREIKFGLFLEKALKLGADFVATGHYVRPQCKQVVGVRNVANDEDGKKARLQRYNTTTTITLFTAQDPNKDQSYFLWTLKQSQLRHCLFPIGDYLKPEVRRIARAAGLPTADKKDSQGICFLGKFSVADFLKKHIRPRRGAIVTPGGEKMGEHDGAQFYTIGQRHLGANSKLQIADRSTNRKPLYVAEKNVRKNILVAVEGDHNPLLYKKEIVLTNVNFINPNIISLIRANKRINILARVRYRQPLAAARLYKLKAKSYKLVFRQSVKFVASGQSAVFYSQNGEMLGGGIIAAAR